MASISASVGSSVRFIPSGVSSKAQARTSANGEAEDQDERHCTGERFGQGQRRDQDIGDLQHDEGHGTVHGGNPEHSPTLQFREQPLVAGVPAINHFTPGLSLLVLLWWCLGSAAQDRPIQEVRATADSCRGAGRVFFRDRVPGIATCPLSQMVAAGPRLRDRMRNPLSHSCGRSAKRGLPYRVQARIDYSMERVSAPPRRAPSLRHRGVAVGWNRR